ncbi:signal peptidase I [Curtobacterium sp. MCLR17_054]|uniref:signal peptidase I n=1 Tax=Curtobacterium sp. MCLR17_054 TaxID=2175632 RepID=UPI0015E8ADF5|nr:signal peptidase I [Curtobacterium sp. MCLR17_054]WIE70321.1 signal peptidase I [Curtobacterium sp. MCLR17_054]
MVVLRALTRTIGILLLALLALPLTWKLVTGDVYVTVIGHSMEPTYQVGDVLVVQQPTGTELRHRGQVVVVRLGNGANSPEYVHRVRTPTATGAWLKGDNNPDRDPTLVRQDHVIGTPRIALTGLTGHLFTILQTWPARALLAITGLLLLLTPLRRRISSDIDPQLMPADTEGAAS